MTKGAKGNRGIASRHSRLTPYPMTSGNEMEMITQEDNLPKASEKKDWEDAMCSICMESPHNAVLLLCSSHEKGCRPYMCGTSFRYSNCLDQYNKAYTKVVGPFSHRSLENPESPELTCPLCRGQVKGWTVVDSARQHLNDKKRSCTHDNCTFIGTYKEMRKHVRAEHPSSKPREVDPTLEQEWRRLEVERETEDVRSTVRSSVPGAVFQGDYVIEGGSYGNDFYSENEAIFDWNAVEGDQGTEVTDESLIYMFRMLRAFGSAGNGGPTNRGTSLIDDEIEDLQAMTLVARLRRQGRVMAGHSWRRRRRREGIANWR